jgi:hypothetical protein
MLGLSVDGLIFSKYRRRERGFYWGKRGWYLSGCGFARIFLRRKVCCGEVVDFGGGFAVLWCEVDGEFVVKFGGMRGKRGGETDEFVMTECGTGFGIYFRTTYLVGRTDNDKSKCGDPSLRSG